MDYQVSLRAGINYGTANESTVCPSAPFLEALNCCCDACRCGVCKTHICWLCGEAIPAAGLEEAQGHYWIKGTACYGMMNDDKQS